MGDIELLKIDSFYVQIFEQIIPQINFKEITPGETDEEIAENITALRDLLGNSILDIDLNYINAEKIIQGDLNHIGPFIQLILEVVMLMAQQEGEDDPNIEDGSSSKKDQSEGKL